MSTARQQLLLLLAATLIFFTSLGKAQLWDDDEPKNAQCAREMFNRGDWIVPTFNGELRCDKPALTYWLMMSAYQAFGDDELAARFWSAVAAVGTTLLTYHVGRLLFDARIGFWSGWMMATSLMFVVAGRAATPDSLLTFFTTLAMFFFVRATWGASGTMTGADRLSDYLPRSWRGMAMVHAALALGVLTKGPVAVLVPVLALVSYAAFVRQSLNVPPNLTAPRRWARLLSPAAWLVAGWRLRPLTAVLMLAVIALPWYAVVGWKTNGDWLKGFFGSHNLSRYLQPMEGHHGPFLYYLPAVLFGFFPWSTFLPQAVVRAVRELRQSASWAPWLFLTCWVGAWIGFFSFSGTKLPSYTTPALPALAVMTAVWLRGWLEQPRSVHGWFLRQSIASLGLAGLAIIAAVPVIDHYFLQGEAILCVVGVPLVLMSIAGLVWSMRRPRLAAGALALGSLAFIVIAFSFAAVRGSRHQNSNALIAALHHSDSPLQPATFDLFVPSQVYYSRLQIPQYGHADDAVKYLNSSLRAVLVTDTRGYEKLQARLPADVTIVARQQRFLRRREIIVLGHRSAVATRPATAPR